MNHLRLVGGELFDHILAHRYLKEKDACRLFAQLMSGVHYLHSKHIVHRDLKLVWLIDSVPYTLSPSGQRCFISLMTFCHINLGKLVARSKPQHYDYRLWIRQPVRQLD